jgi:hypothetical protein
MRFDTASVCSSDAKCLVVGCPEVAEGGAPLQPFGS